MILKQIKESQQINKIYKEEWNGNLRIENYNNQNKKTQYTGSIMEMTHERISESEDIMEIIQFEQQKQNRLKNKINRVLVICRTTLKGLAFITTESQKERKLIWNWKKFFKNWWKKFPKFVKRYKARDSRSLEDSKQDKPKESMLRQVIIKPVKSQETGKMTETC